MSGVMTLVGVPDHPPYVINSEIGYWTAAAFAANATMLAVTYRDVNGGGQHIDVSMQRAMSLGAGNAVSNYAVLGHVLHRGELFARGRGGVKTEFRCKDGWVFYIAAAAGTSMEAARDLLTEHGLGEEFDPRWLDPTLLRQDPVEKKRFEDLMEGFFANFTRVELLEMGFNRQRQVFVVPTGTPRDLVESPQLAAREFFIDVEHPELGRTVRYPGPPYRLPETPWRLYRRAPLIGEHNQEVYGEELGLERAELDRLKEQGVI
jgi:benzylsuccinate CoA-transferase BbsE subunit